MMSPGLTIAVTGVLRRVAAPPPSGAAPAIVQAAGVAQAKTLTLTNPPTVGNSLVLVAGLTHTGSSRTPTGTGWTQAGQSILASNAGITIWTRPVVTGDTGAAGITTSETNEYTNLGLLEVSHASGVVSGLVTSAATVAALTIPAGAVNALPIAVKSSFSNNAYGTVVFPAGWTLAVHVGGLAGSIAIAAADAASTGASIAVTIDGTAAQPRTDTQTSAAFLLEAA